MDKDRFAALMQLAEYVRQARESRRKTEWQLSLALWAMLAAASLALQGKGLSICTLRISGGLIVILHGWWVAWNCYRADSDANNMHNCAYLAELELGIEPIHFERRAQPNRFGFLWHPPALLQWLTTIALVVGSIVIIRGET